MISTTQSLLTSASILSVCVPIIGGVIADHCAAMRARRHAAKPAPIAGRITITHTLPLRCLPQANWFGDESTISNSPVCQAIIGLDEIGQRASRGLTCRA